MHEDFDKTLEELAFAKQFLIAPLWFKSDKLQAWNHQSLTDGLGLYSHPWLNVAIASAPAITLCGLGMFLDPARPEADDQAVLQNLAASCAGFADLEAQTVQLAGRWLLVATSDRQTRVYPDATGQKPIFIHIANGVFAASQPALLEHLGITQKDHDLKERFEAGNNSRSWPVHVTPYRDVRQVLPNHYLTLPEVQTVRFWPVQALPQRTAQDAADEMLVILRAAIRAAMHRQSCVMNLTGGYDSRVILAAAASVWDSAEFFTIKRSDSPHHDLSIPKKLRRHLGLAHRFLKIRPKKRDPVLDRLHANVGGMYYGLSAQSIPAIRHFAGQRLHLLGTISEVNRCFYYRDGRHPVDLCAAEFARRAGFAGNSVAEAGFATWLNELPADLPIKPLDLLYWEHRLGVWSSCQLTFGEGLVDAVPAMNCRQLLQTGLSTPVEQRQAPYALKREMIALAQPELLDFRFNADWVDDWHEFRMQKLPLPWRLKHAMGWTR